MTTYRTQEARTQKILGKWKLYEQLAFDLKESLPVESLVEILPARTKEQLGDFKAIDATFRKLSAGFQNVSEVWIELGRLIGVWDFSVQQTLLGLVAVFLDKENVRVKLHTLIDDTNRGNFIEVICLDRPEMQGKICYEGDRLSFPQVIFEAVIERRLQVYRLNCDYLDEILVIPSESQTSEESELESERNTEAARDRHLELLAEKEDREAERMAEVYNDNPENLGENDDLIF